MKKDFTLKLTVILLSLFAVSCKSSGSAATADSTTLYTGPASKLDSIAAKDSSKKDSLHIGPDSFQADSAKEARQTLNQ